MYSRTSLGCSRARWPCFSASWLFHGLLSSCWQSYLIMSHFVDPDEKVTWYLTPQLMLYQWFFLCFLESNVANISLCSVSYCLKSAWHGATQFLTHSSPRRVDSIWRTAQQTLTPAHKLLMPLEESSHVCAQASLKWDRVKTLTRISTLEFTQVSYSFCFLPPYFWISNMSLK